MYIIVRPGTFKTGALTKLLPDLLAIAFQINETRDP